MLTPGVPLTEDDLAKVDAVLAKGEASVQIADRRVAYRPVKELLEARGFIREAVDGANGTPRRRQFVGVGSKGL